MDIKDFVLYDNVFQSMSQNGRHQANCNTITFFNAGTQVVTIDSLQPLLPNMGYTLEGYPGEMNIHTYEITFQDQNARGCNLVISSKVYQRK